VSIGEGESEDQTVLQPEDVLEEGELSFIAILGNFADLLSLLKGVDAF
jgi:hypothetical protein